MTFGLRSDTVYAATELRNPGWNSSVTAAPPTTPRRSRTVTFRPAVARYAEQTKTLWPPPMMTTSRSPESTTRNPHLMPLQPTGCGSALKSAFRYEFTHAQREAAQRNLVAAQRSRAVAAGMHP